MGRRRYFRPMGSVRWTKLARETDHDRACRQELKFILLSILVIGGVCLISMVFVLLIEYSAFIADNRLTFALIFGVPAFIVGALYLLSKNKKRQRSEEEPLELEKPLKVEKPLEVIEEAFKRELDALETKKEKQREANSEESAEERFWRIHKGHAS